jgi:GST-like protein
MEYPINRFAMEVKRQLDVLDKHLAENEFLSGSDYSIADMATAPWYGRMVTDGAYGESKTFLSTHEYKNVIRWADTIFARPAVKRGRMVNAASGEPSQQLRERHDAGDFDTKTQDKIEAAAK